MRKKILKKIVTLSCALLIVSSGSAMAFTIADSKDYSLTPGSSTKSAKGSLPQNISGVLFDRYVNIAGSTSEKDTLCRYDGFWGTERQLCSVTASFSTYGWKYTRIKYSLVKDTSIGIKMKNTGKYSYDAKKVAIYNQ